MPGIESYRPAPAPAPAPEPAPSNLSAQVFQAALWWYLSLALDGKAEKMTTIPT